MEIFTTDNEYFNEAIHIAQHSTYRYPGLLLTEIEVLMPYFELYKEIIGMYLLLTDDKNVSQKRLWNLKEKI